MGDAAPALFVSTSMQAGLEEIEETEDRNQRQRQVLGTFKHTSSKTTRSYGKQTRPSKVNRRRIKSINSLVSENYSNGPNSKGKKDHKEPKMEHSILRFFSGKKHKIADIIKRIDDVEHPQAGVEFSDTQGGSQYVKSGPRATYTEAEWKVILESIKLKFPSLSSGTKQSLKQLTKQFRESQPEPTMWSQSSFMPSNSELNSDDIRWLYDLEDEDEEQDLSDFVHGLNRQESSGAPFSLTLSQALLPSRDDHSICETELVKIAGLSAVNSGESETISDSEPDDSALGMDPYPPKLQIQETVEFGPISSHQPETFSLIPVGSLLERDRQISVHSSVARADSVRDGEEIFSSLSKESPERSDQRERRTNHVDKESDVFKIASLDCVSSFKSPKKSARRSSKEGLEVERGELKQAEDNHTEEIVSSPIRSLVKVPCTPSTAHPSPSYHSVRDSHNSLHNSFQCSLQDSPTSEQFQTAEQFEALHSVNSELQKKRLTHSYTPKKRFRTSIYEIRGAIEVHKLDVEHVQVRKIATKREVPIDSEEEIGDSEDDFDTSISVMEISREIPVKEINTLIIQVPSSPRA